MGPLNIPAIIVDLVVKIKVWYTIEQINHLAPRNMYKKMMAFVGGILVVFMPAVVLAQYGLQTTGKKIGYSASETIPSVINRVVGTSLSLLSILFFGMMMYAGFRWMLARGNEELAEKAKHTLTAAVIGMAIVVASYGITNLVFKTLRIGSGQISGSSNRTIYYSCICSNHTCYNQVGTLEACENLCVDNNSTFVGTDSEICLFHCKAIPDDCTPPAKASPTDDFCKGVSQSSACRTASECTDKKKGSILTPVRPQPCPLPDEICCSK